MNQNREQCSSGSENVRRERFIPPLNARHVNFMQRLSTQTGIAAADDGREKWFHLPETIRQLRRKRLIIVKEPPIAFLPGFASLTPELFAKVFTNERMRIQLPRTMLIFSREQSC